MGLFNKKELQRIDELERELKEKNYQLDQANKIVEETKGKTILEIDMMIDSKNKEKDGIASVIQELISNKNELENKIDQLNQSIESKEKEIKQLDDDVALLEFGFYEPKYNCLNSKEYAEKIKEVRSKQKEMVKAKQALHYFDSWTLDGSLSKGRAMNNDNMKMYMRAYNNECDNLISKVKFNNIEKIKERIKKVGVQLDNLNKRSKLSITNMYEKLKIEELELCYEYERKKQEEKDLLREQREQEREEAKLKAEIKAAKAKVNKDINQFNNALKALLEREKDISESELDEWKKQVEEIQTKISEKNDELEDIDYREMNAKAGYVYVISNIGAFGENVFKIGMTRRLEPQDRIDELGSASVPFKFDVHAMIFSDDAPKLEAMLHKTFEKNKMNMINQRKEFFNVSLAEIEKAVHDNYDPLVQFKEVPDAEQYRESQKIKEIQG
ncbi:DUF4041 domain-containing protein [Sharpea azabuensis]|uniref:Bacteriophage T5 Orf172 DNA-binding domain-containing protein n=1 Tax=Sharpea azabuensis TaxID=322505 RepID=A0A1H6WZW6_9FIRM|nr:DUF4041 domain-containing protein [Sharpea azabuensis]SEJ17835.1 protein of unknown function [Sharpea azabuensis]